MKNQPAKSSGWTNTQIYTAIVVVLILGGIGGYLLHSSSGSPADTSTALSGSTSLPSRQLPPTTQILSTQTQPLLQRLQANPKDAAAMIELGNIYFDASQWSEAIGYYSRALEITPQNPDARTDMGIAIYYSGDPDRALKEFDRALKDDPRHAQTLFNVGIVRLNGKNDPKGALQAWEKLLQIDPNYQDRARVESLMAQAKAQVK
jgi:cytochrome c-type biogenesis protein CcmH/NrfG